MNIPSAPQVIDIGLLSRFEPITLERMDSIRLLNRIDTKFVTDTLMLKSVLEDALRHGYRAFECDGERLHSYDSIYFDTNDLRMFIDHRRGKLVRQKIRTRVYQESGLCFLEVKKKNNHSRTKKKRIRIPQADFQDFRNDSEACSWLASHDRHIGNIQKFEDWGKFRSGCRRDHRTQAGWKAPERDEGHFVRAQDQAIQNQQILHRNRSHGLRCGRRSVQAENQIY